jgi:hypothetical protein
MGLVKQARAYEAKCGGYKADRYDGIQFILHDVDLHVRRSAGIDWIGFYPSSYGWKGRFYFTDDAEITDFYSWSEYSECSWPFDAVIPLPLW